MAAEIYVQGRAVYRHDLLEEKHTRTQFRFPKSRKARIRRKWSKRDANWKTKIEGSGILDKVNNCIYLDPKSYETLKTQIQNGSVPTLYCNISPYVDNIKPVFDQTYSATLTGFPNLDFRAK